MDLVLKLGMRRVALTQVAPQGENGQGLVEYGLIIGLVAIVAAVAVGGMGTALLNLYNTFPGAF